MLRIFSDLHWEMESYNKLVYRLDLNFMKSTVMIYFMIKETFSMQQFIHLIQ